MAEAVPEANGAEKNDGRAAMVLRWCCGGRGEVDEDTSSAGKAAAVVGDLSLETTAVPGEADNLLDKILKNALAPKVKPENLKKEGVKSEVKSELIKSEVKTEKGIKQEKLDAPALPDIDGAGRLKKRSRSRKKNKKKKSRSRKRRRKSSSSSRSLSKSPVQAALDGLPQARVVAVRGHFAQYLSPAGETFYKNVLTGEIIWSKPGNFDCQPSRRAGEMTPAPGEAACYIFHMPPEWSEAVELDARAVREGSGSTDRASEDRTDLGAPKA
ncbi:Hypothetical protein (Fragment) [Durusdinium trenchii]|uniref:Uncharacterized protein n=1 Tax=Durusdinium trenchii TaxID=1381693 RepID=A0ABP0P1F1_9DINO